MFSSYVYQIPQEINGKDDKYYDDDDDDKSAIFKNKSVFFLINKRNCVKNEKNDRDVALIKSIKDSIKSINKSVSFHVIDIINYATFRLFLENLSNQLLNNTSTISEIKSNLEMLNIKEIQKLSGQYLYIRNLQNFKELLKEMIEKRYQLYEDKFPMKSKSFSLDQIDNEINQFVPLYDTAFVKLYNKIITAKRKSLNELQISSQYNIAYLTSFIISKKYLSAAQLNDILKSHFLYLRNEFLSIIKTIGDRNEFLSIIKTIGDRSTIKSLENSISKLIIDSIYI